MQADCGAVGGAGGGPGWRVTGQQLARGESTQRSQLDAAQLAKGVGDELWLIANGSDLRKPYAQALPALMQVHDLDGDLVPGCQAQPVEDAACAAQSRILSCQQADQYLTDRQADLLCRLRDVKRET